MRTERHRPSHGPLRELWPARAPSPESTLPPPKRRASSAEASRFLRRSLALALPKPRASSAEASRFGVGSDADAGRVLLADVALKLRGAAVPEDTLFGAHGGMEGAVVMPLLAVCSDAAAS